MSVTDAGVPKLKCPVCPFGGIEPGAEKCPQCGTDLSAIQRVRSLAVRFYNEALQEYGRGDVAAAVAKVNASVAIDADFPEARVLLGKLLWRQGHFKAALDQWLQARALSPGDPVTGNLVAEASKSVQARVGRHRTVTVLAAILIIGLATVLILIPGSAARSREVRIRQTLTDQLGSAQATAHGVFGEFQSYRARYTRSDSEYMVVVAEAESATRRWRDLDARFAEYESAAIHAEAENLRQLQEHERAAASLNATLLVLPADRRPVGAADSALGPGDALRTLIHALRPAEADTLLAAMARVRSEVESLGRNSSQAVGKGSGKTAGPRGRTIESAVRKRAAVVESLAAEYSQHYAIWDSVIGILDRPSGDTPDSPIGPVPGAHPTNGR